jgi:hypothetical protein
MVGIMFGGLLEKGSKLQWADIATPSPGVYTVGAILAV